MIILIWLLNFAISWWNAKVVGRSWADSKAIGGWPRVVVWCAAVMSACGFTWCYLITLVMAASVKWPGENPHYVLTAQYAKLAIEIGYVVIILPILGAGLGIWIDSITTAWRQRDLKSVGVAAWNTFAEVHNAYEAATVLPDIFKDIKDSFDDDNKNGLLLILVFALVFVALFAGALTTRAIVLHEAKVYRKVALAT